MKQNRIILNALILFAITIIAGGLLGFVYEVTKEPIAHQLALAEFAALEEVAGDVDTFEEIEEIFEDEEGPVLIQQITQSIKDGEVIGYNFVVTTSRAYDGTMTVAVGIGIDGMTNGISIINHTETPGLGSRITDEDFKNQFKDREALEFAIDSGDNPVDSISSATVSTNAVIGAVNRAVDYYHEHLKEAQ
ncbi:electron transport complex protein RnfG [Natranaerovirga hydrolytica]|uniref:Ion-translocating oxidoreductase complex subunit G n=1 Tax=Natranaerovirga hydrolytica TaxID=680378 RepID=A0A4R1N529_9FIRM|nr:RnfABCDGE type electron transport complex subunit G [Natranaerovirga hydrolytica]TCK98079.1 electron transport complex protein RnfG [Natranaerovirga hydrolytica]